MDYVNFGSAGLRVSPIALGLALRGQPDAAVAQRMVDRALDLGVNLIDCANRYSPMDHPDGFGTSEEILGRALKGRRDRVVITSKVQSRIGPGPNDYGSSRLHITREVENSLRRLTRTTSTSTSSTPSIRPRPWRRPYARWMTWCTAERCATSAAAIFAPGRCARPCGSRIVCASTPFMCVQNPYNLLSRQLEDEIFGLARDQGLGVMVYGPLAVGLLGGAYGPGVRAAEGSFWGGNRQAKYERMMQGQAGRIVSAVRDIADELGKTPAQVATAWILSHPEITVAICGSDTIEQLEDSAGAVGWTLDEATRQRLDEASQPPAVWG